MCRDYFHYELFPYDEFPEVEFLTKTREHFYSSVSIVPDCFLKVLYPIDF